MKNSRESINFGDPRIALFEFLKTIEKDWMFFLQSLYTETPICALLGGRKRRERVKRQTLNWNYFHFFFQFNVHSVHNRYTICSTHNPNRILVFLLAMSYYNLSTDAISYLQRTNQKEEMLQKNLLTETTLNVKKVWNCTKINKTLFCATKERYLGGALLRGLSVNWCFYGTNRSVGVIRGAQTWGAQNGVLVYRESRRFLLTWNM